jgi:hypothetical protein
MAITAGSLTIEATRMPVGAGMEDNPFVDALKDSYKTHVAAKPGDDDQGGRSCVVNVADVDDAVKMIRRAAAGIGIGVTVKKSTETVEKDNKTPISIRVHFLGRELKSRS